MEYDAAVANAEARFEDAKAYADEAVTSEAKQLRIQAAEEARDSAIRQAKQDKAERLEEAERARIERQEEAAAEAQKEADKADCYERFGEWAKDEGKALNARRVATKVAKGLHGRITDAIASDFDGDGDGTGASNIQASGFYDIYQDTPGLEESFRELDAEARSFAREWIESGTTATPFDRDVWVTHERFSVPPVLVVDRALNAYFAIAERHADKATWDAFGEDCSSYYD